MKLHLHKNEENLVFLQPLGWRSLGQQLTAFISQLLRWGPPSGRVVGVVYLGREVGTAFLFIFFTICIFFFCVCVF